LVSLHCIGISMKISCLVISKNSVHFKLGMYRETVCIPYKTNLSDDYVVKTNVHIDNALFVCLLSSPAFSRLSISQIINF